MDQTFQCETNIINLIPTNLSLFSVDSTPPQFLSCPNDISQSIPIGSTTVFVSWNTPFVTDNSGIQPTLSEPSRPVGQFPQGSYTITYQATDGSGNTAECSFVILITQESKLDICLFN